MFGSAAISLAAIAIVTRTQISIRLANIVYLTFKRKSLKKLSRPDAEAQRGIKWECSFSPSRHCERFVLASPLSRELGQMPDFAAGHGRLMCQDADARP